MRFAASVVILIAVGFASFGLAGCERDDAIVAYKAPKETPATQPMSDVADKATNPAAPPLMQSQTPLAAPASGAPMAAAAPTGATPTWTVPATWHQDPAKPMRVASFHTADANGGAEVIVSRFGADNFGGILQNINRWRGEAGLEPVSDPSAVQPERTQVGGADAAIFDFAGPAKDGQPARRVRVAMAAQADAGEVWFFKIRGPADVVGNEQQAFDSFVQSVRFAPAK